MEIMTIKDRADAILASTHTFNAPYEGDSTKRIVGWVVDADVAGISEGVFALEEIKCRAKR